jgi:hypothetical protein
MLWRSMIFHVNMLLSWSRSPLGRRPADMESWTTVVDGLLQRWIYSNVRALDGTTSWW